MIMSAWRLFHTYYIFITSGREAEQAIDSEVADGTVLLRWYHSNRN